MTSRRRRLTILAAAIFVLVAAAYVAYVETGPSPSGAQVASLLRRLPENTLARRIVCRGSLSSWTCHIFGPGPGGSLYDVHVGRDGTVTVPPGDGLRERHLCCVK